MALLSRWSDLRLHAKGLIVVAVPAAATIVIASALYVVGSRGAEAEQAVERSYRIGEQIQRLKSCAIAGSAQVRGYFLTGDPLFAARARDAIAAFDGARQELAGLAAGDNPQGAGRLDEIARLERSRVERMVAATTRFQWGALSGDQLRLAVRAAETERAELESILTAMQEDEQVRLASRLHLVATLRSSLRVIAGICVFLGVIGGVAISLLFASGITNRIGRLQRNVARLTMDGVLEPLPDGGDEIGELSEGLAKAARILHHRTAALENASHGIAEADAADRYLDFNRAFTELTGLRHPDASPSVTTSVYPGDRDAMEGAIRRMRETGRAEIEVRVVHPEGRIADLGMTFVPVSKEPESGYFMFVSDIGRRKEAEASLVQARDAAVAASLAKSEFLAKISHDIRTPLNAILGAADLLSESPLNPVQLEYVGMFQRNCRRLVALINDFLDFSKLEAGAVRIESIRYRTGDTIEEALATFREAAYRKGVTLGSEIGLDVPEWNSGDPLRVHQVLVNLLSNALKFTEEGHVKLSVARTSKEGKELLHVSVSDSGPGIPTEDLQRVFDAFAQTGKQPLGEHHGCGLGLAICRELVERMGGEIGVTSEAGVGSAFYFTLPLTAPPFEGVPQSLPVRPAVTQVQAHSAPLRLLVAEDIQDNRVLLEHYLRGQQIAIEFAEDGQAALDALRRGPEFDLVLMDLDMPVLDGFGAAQAIRAWELQQGVSPTPIVGLSAHAMREAVLKCLDSGCVAHVAKPFDRTTLLNAIRCYGRRDRGTPAAAAPVSEQVAALVPKYLASKPKQIDDARASLKARDFEPIRRFGHNLKGTGCGYGFAEIETLGAGLEKAAIERNERDIALQLEALRKFVAREQLAPV